MIKDYLFIFLVIFSAISLFTNIFFLNKNIEYNNKHIKYTNKHIKYTNKIKNKTKEKIKSKISKKKYKNKKSNVTKKIDTYFPKIEKMAESEIKEKDESNIEDTFPKLNESTESNIEDTFPKLNESTEPNLEEYFPNINDNIYFTSKLKERDQNVVFDPLTAPEMRVEKRQYPRVMFSEYTRGIPDEYQLMGVLYNNEMNKTYQLYGRQTYPGSYIFEYYYRGKDTGGLEYKFPIDNNIILNDGDTISLITESNPFTVKIYNFDSPKYIPYI